MTISEYLESEEFYNLAQAYRNAPLVPQKHVVEAFKALQGGIREAYAAGFNLAAVQVITDALAPDCDCEQEGNPDVEYHSLDCNWRVYVEGIR